MREREKNCSVRHAFYSRRNSSGSKPYFFFCLFFLSYFFTPIIQAIAKHVHNRSVLGFHVWVFWTMRLKNLHKLPTLVILGVFGAMRVYVCHATFFGQRTRDRCVRAHCHGQICIRANHWPQNSDVPNMPTLKTVIAFFSSAIAHNWLEIQIYPLCLPKQKKERQKFFLS